MPDRFKKRFYKIERIGRKDDHLCFITNEDGTLFSGNHKTKIMPEDLPEWYIYGRYYKCFGYMSAKGITYMVYLPSRFSNHFLKDDCLLVAYGGKIEEKNDGSTYSRLDRYTGFDERIWGSEIISILKGVRKYSGYNIDSLTEKIREKATWMAQQFPDDYGPHGRWNIDVDKLFEEDDDA